VFDANGVTLGKVNQDHRGAEPDRLLVAQLTGEARHGARWRPLTEDEEAAALAELRALAEGLADLLAEVAGIFEGTSEGEPDEPLARSAARLCRLAGADTAAIPAWVEEGRPRSEIARRPPFSGGVHSLRYRRIERPPQLLADRLVAHQSHGLCRADPAGRETSISSRASHSCSS
jgi:hypothetical protein